jgi:hypothetical protein
VLVGSVEIPDQFPGIVREGLASGIDWPAIPGFVPPVESGEPTAQATMVATPSTTASPPATATEIVATATVTLEDTETTSPTPDMEPTTVALAEEDSASLILDSSQQEIAFDDSENPPADPVGFALSTAILIIMVLACAYVAWRLLVPAAGAREAGRITIETGLGWAIPLLAIVALGVAAYLAYVEVNQVAAVCGPVGHCNLVQSSSYARIVGVPIALLGIVSYVAIIILWVVDRFVQRDSWKMAARIGLIALTVFGTLFSIYLTLLELFVIHAVCAWCLTSAVVMTILMVLIVRSTTQHSPELAPE